MNRGYKLAMDQEPMPGKPQKSPMKFRRIVVESPGGTRQPLDILPGIDNDAKYNVRNDIHTGDFKQSRATVKKVNKTTTVFVDGTPMFQFNAKTAQGITTKRFVDELGGIMDAIEAHLNGATLDANQAWHLHAALKYRK